MVRSLQRRFVITFILITAVFLGFLGYYLINGLGNYIENNIKANLTNNGRLISVSVRELLEPPQPKKLGEYAREAGETTGQRVTIINAEGKVLGDSRVDEETWQNQKGNPEIWEALNGRVGASIRYSPSFKKDVLYVALPVKKDGKILGVTRVSIPKDQIIKARKQVRFSAWMALILIFVLTTFLASSLSRKITIPLREMTAVAQDIAEGKLNRRVKINTRDEIGALAKSLNNLAVRLRENINEITDEKNKIEAILTSMKEGVIAIDKKGHILLINPAVEKMFDVKYPEVIGKKIIEVIRHYELERIFQRALEVNDYTTKELQFLVPEPKIFRLHLAPLKGQEEVAGIVAILRDVTELRKLEQMRTEFVANVSHELRTPLTSIKGFVETLLDGALEDPAVSRRFLEIINDETNRLNRLISDILNLSRLEARKTEINKVYFRVEKTINNVVSMLEPLAAEKNLSLKVEIHPGLKEIYADKDMIGQVFINLIDNAIKYTPAGGEIKVELYPKEEGLNIKVSDTGIGIPPESIPRLFERFYRVDKARSRELGGTGLGLAIVKHIIDAHEGTVSVESKYGKGTTFHIFIPSHEG